MSLFFNAYLEVIFGCRPGLGKCFIFKFTRYPVYSTLRNLELRRYVSYFLTNRYNRLVFDKRLQCTLYRHDGFKRKMFLNLNLNQRSLCYATQNGPFKFLQCAKQTYMLLDFQYISKFVRKEKKNWIHYITK